MGRYLVRRLAQAVPVVILITLLSFGLMSATPGSFINPLDYPGQIGEEQMQRIRQELGLDKPWYEQYAAWVGKLAQLDLGRSYVYHQPVLNMIMDRLPATLELTLTSLLLSLTLGIVIGVAAAVNRATLFDNLTRIFAVAGHAVPGFWLGLILIWIFAVILGWLPSGGIATVNSSDLDFGDLLKHLVLPALILSFGRVANFSRYVRGEMLDVIRQDYIRTARAKGLSERLILYRHALRNALIPLITVLGLNLSSLFGGAVLIEIIFAWPGMGRLIVDAAFQRDYPVVMGATLFSAVLVIAGNLLADIAYAFVDPRIKQT